MNEQEQYVLYKRAKETGGPCEICGWRDGDGVRTCFYSQELGAVTHQNSDRGAMATMTAAQQHLYTRRQVLVFISEALREQYTLEVSHRHLYEAARYRAQGTGRPFTADEHGREITDEEWIADFRASQMKKGVATDPRYTGWFSSPWWVPIEYSSIHYAIPKELRGIEKTSTFHGREGDDIFEFTAYMTHLYEPHSCGKGYQYSKEPYYLACTGCDTEIKLWEHGVDYDVG